MTDHFLNFLAKGLHRVICTVADRWGVVDLVGTTSIGRHILVWASIPDTLIICV